jgi:hypothetical protein
MAKSVPSKNLIFMWELKPAAITTRRQSASRYKKDYNVIK